MASKYHEGAIFAVPLRTTGYAPGVIARCGKEPVLFGYLFAVRLKQAVAPEGPLVATEASWLMRFADLGIIEGPWAIVGQVTPWNRADWPMPDCQQVGRDASIGLRIRVSEDEPVHELWRRPATLDQLDGLPVADMHGSGTVEIAITTALDPEYQYEPPFRRDG